MFPDSEVAKLFSMSKTKCSYMILFGIASLFQKMPMMPFLTDSLVILFKRLMRMVVIQEVVDDAKYPTDLIKINLKEKNDLLPDRVVKLSTATSNKLRHSSMTEVEKMKFRRDCKEAIITLLEKLLERSPLKYKICRLASCVNPGNMVEDKIRSKRLF